MKNQMWVKSPSRRRFLGCLCVGVATPAAQVDSESFPLAVARLAVAFAQQVDRRLDIPDTEHRFYAESLERQLTSSGTLANKSQLILLVDANPLVQAAMVYGRSSEGVAIMIGACAVSTGKPGRFAHFYTPEGVFEHSLAAADFRAEGSRNEFGIRGYGRKGMRVYDFGWRLGRRGWGRGGLSPMRLQMHSTDPALLEPKLGSAQSSGCVRIHSTFNTFLDHYGVLDADYDHELLEGSRLWVLQPDRQPTPWAGRYMVVVESDARQRPEWSPLPPSIGPAIASPSHHE